ncbi:MAG: sugar ABC transporter ATP-binding protein, partial [Comamonadaceae bacterium]|nr:sugar ABC transporter ATP-binding protein [Comamonadaceae bacterium]
MSTTNPAPVLELTGVDKNFSGIPVLSDVQLRLYPGEIHALMGQNGAGKSTLIKVLTGAIEASGGEMRLAAEDLSAVPPQARSAPSGGSDPRSGGEWGPSTPFPDSPRAAQSMGISTVYQEVNLCPNLSVAENIFAGRYPRHGLTQGYRIDWATVNLRARELVARIGLDIDVTRLLSDYPVAVQQLVAIARALSIESRVLILDEPTSSLDDDEVQKLFEVLRRLRSEGLAIVFVTHFLNQVYAISDRITVLRNGRWVGEWPVGDLPPQALIAAMLGRELAAQSTATAVSPDFDEATPALLQAEGLGQSGQLHAMDLRVRAGEVVGLAGLLGSGRTELARLLFGLAEPDRGVLRIDGQTV